MPTLREWFNPGKVISQLGALKFKTSIFRDEIRYPHYEMDKALELYETRPQINSGIKQFVRFVIGNEVLAKSDDDRSKEFLEKWIEQRAGIKTEILNFATINVVTGNSFLEPSYITSPNGVVTVDNVFNVPDPSRVYYNLDTRKTEDEFWLYEVPIEVKMFPFQGQEYKPKFWRVNYIRGSILFQRLVYAIPVHKSKLIHFKTGWSRDGLYGRGFISSCVDDGEVLLEILKNLAIISRTRALNTKLISLGTEEDRATIADINKLDFDLKNRKENEHILINKPVSAVDLGHQGRYDKMEETLTFLRKDIASGLVPNFITPWNESVNRATASEIKIPFQLEIDSVKEDIISFLNETIIKSLRQAYPWLAEDLSFDLGVIDLTSQDERMGYAAGLFTSNAITLNEYREAAGYDAVEDGDVWGYQLPSLPIDQQSVSMEEAEGDVDMTAAPTQAEKIKIPSPKSKTKVKKNVKLTEIPTKPRFEERVRNGLKTDEDLPLEEVFLELYETASSVEQIMQKMKIGTLIKTKSAHGNRLDKLQKGDKKGVLDVIKKSLGKNLEMKKTPIEFRKDLKAEIQKYRKGQPKYDDYVIDRIARTELSKMREARKLLKWREEGYSKVKHVTHRTKASGKKDIAYNGKIFNIDYLLTEKADEDRIPLHPNCRCTYIPHD